MKRLGWIIVLVIVVVGLGALRMKRVNQKENAPLLTPAPPTVEVSQVRMGRVAGSRRVTGAVIADNEAAVAPLIMAQILEIKVREGDHVTSGDLLAVLDTRELEEVLSQAEAGFEANRSGIAAAEAAWQTQKAATDRNRLLFEAKAISEEQLEVSRTLEISALARLDAARAELQIAAKRRDQARTRRGYADLKAPFDGRVVDRSADPGDLAIPGKAVLTLIRNGPVRVRVQLPADDLSAITEGLPLQLSLGGATIDATISRVVPAMDRSRLAVFEVDLRTPPASFVSGAIVGVDLELWGSEGIVVPTGALLEGEHGIWVFTVEHATVHPVKVEVRAQSTTEAVVIGDLDDGDVVVIAQPSRLMLLADGMKVLVHGGEK
jgi:RND family efflux transporter MFP subunit